MAHKVILPPKKNYIPQFLKQRDINSYFRFPANENVRRTEMVWHKRKIQMQGGKNRVGNLSPAMGRGIDFRNRVWNWVAKLHGLAGQYDNPMPTWFIVPIAGLKLPTLDFAERESYKPVLLRLSLVGNLEKRLMSLYGTKWRKRGYGVHSHAPSIRSHRGTKKWFFQISSQWESQKNRFAFISFGKIQFLPPCIWYLPFVAIFLIAYRDLSYVSLYRISPSINKFICHTQSAFLFVAVLDPDSFWECGFGPRSMETDQN